MKSILFLLLLSLPALFCSAQDAPVLRVIDFNAVEYTQINQNSDLEQVTRTRFLSVQPYGTGYKVAAGEGIDASTSAVCDNPGDVGMGLVWNIPLHQKTPEPIRFTGSSKAQGVEGSPSSNYSLYVDLVYDDGSPSWGHQAHFETGSHDWQEKSVLILPEKPVRSVSCYALFRNIKGKAWFDNLKVEMASMPEGMIRFDGLSAQLVKAVSQPTVGTTVQTEDGLTLTLDPTNGALAAITADNKPLPLSPGMNGFNVRDVGQSGDYYPFKEGQCQPVQCDLQLQVRESAHAIHLTGTLKDTTGQPRALNLVYAIPLDAIGWQWGETIRSSLHIAEAQEYATGTTIGTGSNGKLSMYPYASIHGPDRGVALGIDYGQPLQYRLGYSGGSRTLYCSMDLGLHPETANFPSQAQFELVIYPIDPAWGFRSATQQYYQIFPDYFTVRSKDQGIWMPFTDVSTVEGWQDFGFKYHEGTNNVQFDDENNILSFRYTEPSTWWMAMPKEMPRTYDNAMQLVEEIAKGTSSRQENAEALLTSGSYNENQRYQMLFRNEPWCDGAVFSLNPSPYLDGEITHASTMWNEEMAERLYGPNAAHQQDGEYLDSLEAYVTADLNFRTDHFNKVTFPLTFTMDTHQPVIHKAFTQYEFTRHMGEEMHKRDKLLFANSVPYRFGFLCPWLDVMGTETNWIQNNTFTPDGDNIMNYRRTLSGQKPYLFLMNTRFDAMTSAIVERYFQHCLFYGMFPSMFSHNAAEDPYWRNPALYNRDRPLFRRYLPVIKTIAEAGWEPISLAHADQGAIWVERYGNTPEGPIYLTVMNSSDQDQDCCLRGAGLLGQRGQWTEMLSQQSGLWEMGLEFTIPAHGVQVYQLFNLEKETAVKEIPMN